jgi:hypothetical protein
MGTNEYKGINDMLHENQYMHDTYFDELEVAKGKELNSATLLEERQEIENRYSEKMEYEEDRFQTFKATSEYAEETRPKIEELRDSYQDYENEENDWYEMELE